MYNILQKIVLVVGMVSCFSTKQFAQHGIDSGITPVLSSDVKITYRNSNPLKDALKALPETAIFKMDGYYLWDPSVIKVGETYHLFCSRWPADKGMNGWLRSHVIRATSKSLFGPYVFKDIVLEPTNHPWATQAIHNPKVIKVGNKFLLYHLGIPKWVTGFALADSIQGPWIPVNKPVILTNNPALLVRKDGSAYAVGKFKPKVFRDGIWDACMNAFEADNYLGPYKLVKDTLNRLPNHFELEDPTIWWANNQYNVICTDWEAKVTGIEKSIVYYTSKNGIDYELFSQIPVWSQREPVPLENGSVISVKGLERPQVYTNEKNELEALLVSVYPFEKIPTYIMIRPVNNFLPTNQ
jgi:hypothetical protein